MAAVPMPARGHATAPQFDAKNPRELRRYFEELEFLFTPSNITAAQEKKQYAARYVDIDTAGIWTTTPEYLAGSSWDQFKTAILKLYPGAEDDRIWSMSDLDKLIGEQLRYGILDTTTLGAYHRSFLAITRFLIDRHRLSTTEQNRAFVRGFNQDLRDRIHRRLDIKYPDHHPDDSYPIDQVLEAAKYVLHGTSPTALPTGAPSAPPTTDSSSIKKEDLATYFDKFAQQLVQALGNSNRPAPRNMTTYAPVNTNSAPPRPQNNEGLCNFCGLPDHFLSSCLVCEEYINEGKCKRNADGKIVLPTGAFCPRFIPGRWLKDRINEWHRRNQGQISTSSTMMYEVSRSQPRPSNQPVYTADSRHPQSFHLSATDRLAALEYEIKTLQNRKMFDGVEILKRPQRKPEASTTVDPPRVAKTKPVQAPTSTPAPAPQPSTVDQPTTQPAQPPVHPFAKVREPNYLPPHDRNFAAPPQPPKPPRDPAYQVHAPIENPKIASAVYSRWLKETNVTLTPEELLSLSPEVRGKVREAVTTKRVPPQGRNVGVALLEEEDPLPFAEESIDIVDHTTALPPDAFIIPDPVETYINSSAPADPAETLTVARETDSLRAIDILISNKEHVNAIIDPGSQIIAMSELICHDLGLVYDPRIKINMQSANGDVDPSLGLSRNVPCRIGNITVYLQIHVIRNAAYDLLLGRPFDVLTRSVVKNFADGFQTLTIRDPNTGDIATVPTIERRPPRRTRSSTTADDRNKQEINEEAFLWEPRN